MKVDKLNLDGKKDTIEVLDKIFSAKINKRLVDNVLYKNNRLTGDFGKYMDSFINVPDKVGKPIERRTAQVISFADFKNGRDGR